MSLQIGDAALDFTLPDQNGESVSLLPARDEGCFVLLSQGRHPCCTKEACNFRDVGSTEGQQHHRSWDQQGRSHLPQQVHQQARAPFTLLDEEPCAVATLYESYGLKKFMGREYMGMMRHTFLINEEGKLERIYLKVKAATMADTLISDLNLN